MTKTPVTILQELMQKIGGREVPQYELISSEGLGTHVPTFYYRVTAKNVTKIGKGGTKKDAKHEGARLVLEELQNMGIYIPEAGAAPASPVSVNSTNVSTFQVNAVGLLQEFCTERNIPQPEFTLLSDIGPAHLREFTYNCQIGTMPECRATDLTKKKAKQAAAQKMLHRLMDSLPDEIEAMEIDSPSTTPAISQAVLGGYKEHSELSRKKINWGLKVSSYTKIITNIMKEKNISYEELWRDIEVSYIDLEKVLKRLDLNCLIEYVLNENGNNLVGFISIGSEPEFAVAHCGENKAEIENKLIQSAFEFLRIMSKKVIL